MPSRILKILIPALVALPLLAISAQASYRLLLPPKADQSKGTPCVYHPGGETRSYRQLSQYVRMDDGTRIAVEIYLPRSSDAGARFPTMFEQSRYWRVVRPKFPLNKLYRKQLSLYRDEFINHGYAWVAMDLRGAGASFGDRPWDFSPIDIADCKQMLDWIVAQPWCNGKIGTIGHSYSGNLAELALVNKHPSVKAAAILSSPFDVYADVPRPGGIPLQPFVHDWATLTRSFDRNEFPPNLHLYAPLLKKMKPVQDDKAGKLLREAVKEHQQNTDLSLADKINFKDDYSSAAEGKHTVTFEKCLSSLKSRYGENFESRGTELISPSGYWADVDAARVPMYMAAGWWEGANANAAIKRFMNYTTPGCKLIIGPWDHNLFNISPFTRGGPTRFRMDRELLKFFDSHLKDVATGLESDQAVNYFTLGEESWHASNSWPPASVPFRLFLGDKHQLRPDSPQTAGGDKYRIDFAAGTGHQTRWDCLLGNVLLEPYPHRASADKHLLVYDSAPLNENIRITGHPSLKVFLKPNETDCSLFVYLEDVSPGGLVRYVTEGELYCGNRINSQQKPVYKTVVPQPTFLKQDYQPLDPRKTTEIDIAFLPISFEFKRGHRIRLALAGADRDHFTSPGFGHPSTEFEIQWGAASLSQLSLPQDNE